MFHVDANSNPYPFVFFQMVFEDLVYVPHRKILRLVLAILTTRPLGQNILFLLRVVIEVFAFLLSSAHLCDRRDNFYGSGALQFTGNFW